MEALYGYSVTCLKDNQTNKQTNKHKSNKKTRNKNKWQKTEIKRSIAVCMRTMCGVDIVKRKHFLVIEYLE